MSQKSINFNNMRRYSLIVFIVIFLITAIILISSEKSYIEKKSTYINSNFKIKDIEIKNNYILFNAGMYAIISYKNNFNEEILPGTKLLVRGEIFDLSAYPQKDYANFLKSRGYKYLIKAKEYEKIDFKSDLYTLLYNTRVNLGKQIDSLYRIDSPFIKALVYGEKNELNKKDTDMFSKTGISHLLAISGFHISLIGTLILLLLKDMGVKLKYFLLFILISFFVLLTGARPSALRAGIFYFIYVISIFSNNRYDVVSCTFLISSLFMSLNSYIIYDAGFTLSFMAVLSIGLFYDIISKFLKKFNIIPLYLRSLINVTVAAQILTVPLTYYYFKRVSFISIVANLVSVPLVTILYPFIFASLILSQLPVIGDFLIFVVILLKNLLFRFNNIISNLYFSYIDFNDSNIYTTIVIYLIIFIAYILYLKYNIKENKNDLQGFIKKY